MTEPIKKVSSHYTGRYTITTNTTDNNAKTTTIKFYAKDGTQLKPDYYTSAEISDAANQSDYGKYYTTRPAKLNNGKFGVAVTVKESQKVGILASDFLGVVDDGTITKYNPHYFDGYDAGYTGDGKPLSNSNKKMKKGDTIYLPADRIKLDSPAGWFTRNIFQPVYQVRSK